MGSPALAHTLLPGRQESDEEREVVWLVHQDSGRTIPIDRLTVFGRCVS